jgi:hypothetical protein
VERQEYNLINALVYEVILFLQGFFKFFKNNPIIKQILKNCFSDWCAFRAELAIQEVDKQVEALHKQWEQEEKQKTNPIYSEKPPDGSQAQTLLGGEMRLTAPFYAPLDTSEPDSEHEKL